MHPKLHIEDKHGTITIRVSTGALPDLKLVSEIIAEAHATFADDRSGAVADYIPALARVSPELFGISVVGVAGREVGIGDRDHLFSIQSISKPFVFALVCQEIGAEVARDRIGVNATGLPFNSVMAVELNTDRTMNPMVNAGAIATTSCVPGATADEKFHFIKVSGLQRLARAKTLPGVARADDSDLLKSAQAKPAQRKT